MPDKKRFWELDLLRGLAVTGMIVFHFFFLLQVDTSFQIDVQSGWWFYFGQLIRFDFLGLVGVGMVISYYRMLGKGFSRSRAILQQWKRALVVGACAAVVTLASYWYIPQTFIRFGILHLITVSIFFWSFFVEWKWIVLILSLGCFWLGAWGNFTTIGLGYFLKDMMWNVQAVDYFPLFPWMGIVGLGIFFGHVFYPKGARKWEVPPAGENQLLKGICFLGRHSLMVYMVHVPIIILILLLVALLRIS